MKVSDEAIQERRAEYTLALKNETEASSTVRQMWRVTVAICNEVLEQRVAARLAAAENVSLRAALEQCIEALRLSYDVTSYPADGYTMQDEAMKAARAALKPPGDEL